MNNKTHYHRVENGAELGTYEWMTVAAFAAALNGGTIKTCACEEGALYLASLPTMRETMLTRMESYRA